MVDIGYFWFFDWDNVEVVIKIFDVCVINQNYWVFVVGLIDVEVMIMVIDIEIGVVQVYENLFGIFFVFIQDISVFGICF